jgi:hypothetical protein
MRPGKAPWWVSLALIAIAAVGCDKEAEVAGDECVDDKRFFQQEVWSDFVAQQCYSCHNSGGQANASKLVFQSEAQTGFIDANFAAMREMAAYQHLDNGSLLLLKPTMSIAHDGGKVIEKDSKQYQALVELMNRFDNPVTCGDSQTGEHFETVSLLDPNETFRKATVNLGSRLPTALEEFRIATGGEEALDEELEQLLHEDAFYVRLEEMFNDMFLTDRYLGRTNALDLLDDDYYPQARWFVEDEDNVAQLASENQEFLANARLYTNDSMARENLKLATYLVKNRLPFTQILTSDYMVMNPYTARSYGVQLDFENPMDPNEWKPGQIPGVPHAGVLTSAMWLNRFPTTPTNRNRHRARMVYYFFLATDVNRLADRPLDPTNIVDFNPTMNNANCNVCHRVIDPLAGSLQNWDERGNYAPMEGGWFTDMISPGFEAKKLDYGKDLETAAQWLAGEIVADPRFATSMVHHMYRGLTGLNPLVFPTDATAENYVGKVREFEVQTEVFESIAQKFRDGDHDLRIVFKELIKSQYFRAKGLNDVEKAQEVDELGSMRMLTPELLDRKILAVLGLPWAGGNNNDNRYLLNGNEYRLLYGGIDSNDVTERITSPNGIMANIQLRMANEMACRVTARDFTEPTQKRRLFPLVEVATTPFNEVGFIDQQNEMQIRKNIAHMHNHVLGERLDVNSSEVTRTYNIFLQTLQEGQLKMKAGDLTTNLECRATTNMAGIELPAEQQITRDDNYTIRAWMAVVTYLLMDYRFIYE